MTKKTIEELKEQYSQLSKKHPKINLDLVEDIKNLIISESKEQSKGLTAHEISVHLKISKEKISNRLRMMVESKDIQISKGGKSRFFVSEELINGSFGDAFFGRIEIDSATKDRFNEVIDIYKNKPSLLEPELAKDLSKVKQTINASKHNFRSHSKLVDSLWTKGFTKIKKLLPRNTANRYSI